MTLVEAETAVDRAYAWAETPARQVCTMRPEACPTTTGGYCIECHMDACNAVARIQLHLFALIRYFLGQEA